LAANATSRSFLVVPGLLQPVSTDAATIPTTTVIDGCSFSAAPIYQSSAPGLPALRNQSRMRSPADLNIPEVAEFRALAYT
jgi:hypothetical protein